MSDEGLDNIFKNGLSGRDVKFNMESWRRMEQMLPPEPKAGKFRFGYAAALIGFLLLVTASLFVWDTDWNGSGDQYAANQMGAVNGLKTSSQSEVANRGAVIKENNALESTQDSKSSVNSEVINSIEGNKNNSNSLNQTNQQKVTRTSLAENTISKNENSNSKTNAFMRNPRKDNLFGKRMESSVESTRSEGGLSEDEITVEKNMFTSIDGIGELSSLELNGEETPILVANVSNGKLPKADKNVLGFIGGVNLNKALVESPESGISGSEFLGIEYQRFLNRGFSVKTNFLYSARNDVNSHKMYDKKVYDFGSSTEQTMVECQRMIYLELPILMNYGVGNHNFMMGPSFSYLVSSLNKMTTHYESYTNVSTEESSFWGHTNGFKSYDFSIVAGYEYSVKPKLNVGMRLNYGLIDLTDNAYFGDDSFDNNVQFRVYLTYSPFQF